MNKSSSSSLPSSTERLKTHKKQNFCTRICQNCFWFVVGSLIVIAMILAPFQLVTCLAGPIIGVQILLDLVLPGNDKFQLRRIIVTSFGAFYLSMVSICACSCFCSIMTFIGILIFKKGCMTCLGVTRAVWSMYKWFDNLMTFIEVKHHMHVASKNVKTSLHKEKMNKVQEILNGGSDKKEIVGDEFVDLLNSEDQINNPEPFVIGSPDLSVEPNYSL